jgi:hypothetical protein
MERAQAELPVGQVSYIPAESAGLRALAQVNLTLAATVSFEPKMAFGGVQVPPHQLNISVDACSADLPSIQALSFLACCRRACFCAATNE